MDIYTEEYSRDLPCRTVWCRSVITVLILGPCGMSAFHASLMAIVGASPIGLLLFWMTACAGRALWVKKLEWHVHLGLAMTFVFLSYWLGRVLPGLFESIAKNVRPVTNASLFELYMGLSGWLLVLSLILRHWLGGRKRSAAKA